MNVKMEENYNTCDGNETSLKKNCSINNHKEKLIKPNDAKFLDKPSCEKLVHDVIQSDVETAADLSEVEPDIPADAELEAHGDLENDVEYEADVELEADAESLSSCDGSENSSRKNNTEVKYFRFTRKGLSIVTPIRLETSTSDVPLVVVDEKCTLRKSQCGMSEGFSNAVQEDVLLEINSTSTIGCPIIDFQKECFEKYPSWYNVGVRVDKFARFHDAPLKSSLLAPPKQATSSNFIPSSSEGSERISTLNVTETNEKISSTGDLNDSTKSRVEMDSVAIDGIEAFDEPTISNSSFQRDDRLSNVIQDILHRLNRQGTLAVPSDVCRKGGGKSGNYYDKDDDFVDDSLTFAVLGLSPSISHQSTHTAKSDVLGLHDSFYEDPLSDSLHDDDDESFLEFYDYKNSLAFTCDNLLENDFQLHVNEASDDVIKSADNQQGNLSQEHSSDDEDEETSHDAFSQQEDAHIKNLSKASQAFVTTKYWIKRKAWREYESKLNPYLLHVLSRLETILIDKGNRHGLFVSVAEIAPLFREAVQDVFDKEYPHVSWNSSTFVTTSYSEALYAQNSIQNMKELKQEVNGYPLPKSTQSTTTKVSQIHSIQESTNNGLKNFSKEDISKNTVICNTVTPEIQETLSKTQPKPHETNDSCLINSTYQCVSQDSLLEDTTKSNIIRQNLQKGSVQSPQTPNVTDTRQSILNEDKNNKTSEKKHRKKCILEPNFHNTVTLEDIVPLVISPSMKLLGMCLMKVSNMIHDDLLKKWLLVRLVLHNQVVYSALEHRLYRYITQKSSLFRTKGSFFFRNLKKAVDAYLKSLVTSSEATIKSTSHNKNSNITTPNSSGTPLPSTPLAAASTHVNGKLSRDKYCKSVSVYSTSPPCTISVTDDENITKAVSESPFITIAKELLNWAIVYNCRRHELKEIGETLDEWTVSFPTYAVDILNQSIQKRRNITSMTSSSASSLPPSTQAQRKNRIWVPIKFMEKTLAEFKAHFGVLTLNERRGRKTTMPQFLLPCKGLDPPVSRACKPSGQPRQSTKKVSSKAIKDLTKPMNSSSSSTNIQSNPSGCTQPIPLEFTQLTPLDPVQPTTSEPSQCNTAGFNPLSVSKFNNSANFTPNQLTSFERIQSTPMEISQTTTLEANQPLLSGSNESNALDVNQLTAFNSTQHLTSSKDKVTSYLPLKSLSVKKRKRQVSENLYVDAKNVIAGEEGDVNQPKIKKNNVNEKISESSKESARTFNSSLTKGNPSVVHNKVSPSGKVMSLSEYFTNARPSTDVNKTSTNVLRVVPKQTNTLNKSDNSETPPNVVVDKNKTSLSKKEKSPKTIQPSISVSTPKISAFSKLEKAENTLSKEKASCFIMSQETSKQNNSLDTSSLNISRYSETSLASTKVVYTSNSKPSNSPKTEVKTTGTVIKSSSPNCASLTDENSEKSKVSSSCTFDPNGFPLLTHQELSFNREPSKTMAPNSHIPSAATPFHTIRPSFLQHFPLSVPFPLMNTSMTHPNMLNNSAVFPSIPFDTIMMQMNKMYYPLPNSIYSTSNYPWPPDTSVSSTSVRPINPFSSSSSTISSDKI